VLDRFKDLPEASLSYGERVERAEWEEDVARAVAPVPATLAPLVSRWVALQPRADSTDRQPILQDLDVITAVRGICSGQTSYTVETLHQRFRSFERNAYPSIVMFLPRMSDYTLTASKQ